MHFIRDGIYKSMPLVETIIFESTQVHYMLLKQVSVHLSIYLHIPYSTCLQAKPKEHWMRKYSCNILTNMKDVVNVDKPEHNEPMSFTNVCDNVKITPLEIIPWK